ncbi:MAG: phage holin family protein [Clostridiales bacterium]|nr:phage holin family protein [Clostridia bacterium]MCR4564003.1 phage holin family protein [Clostridiales bacterium]
MEKYLFEQSLILIPALNILGLLIKQTENVKDKYIPLILLIFGLAGSFFINGLSVQAAIQGVLVTGVAVYGNQVIKQLRKSE